MDGVSTYHPSMTAEYLAEVALMRDAVAGESAIKAKSEIYLPKPSGFAAMTGAGDKQYAAYKTRAQFPEILAPSVSAMVGIGHGSGDFPCKHLLTYFRAALQCGTAAVATIDRLAWLTKLSPASGRVIRANSVMAGP